LLWLAIVNDGLDCSVRQNTVSGRSLLLLLKTSPLSLVSDGRVVFFVVGPAAGAVVLSAPGLKFNLLSTSSVSGGRASSFAESEPDPAVVGSYVKL